MGRINRANLKKTVYYLKRNGLKQTWYAVRERLEEKKQPPYVWAPPSEAELEAQRTRWKEEGFRVTFSILVPTYRTKPEYLKELIDSLRRQTYPRWELILADATEDDSVERIVQNCLPVGSVAGASVSGNSPSGNSVSGTLSSGSSGSGTLPSGNSASGTSVGNAFGMGASSVKDTGVDVIAQSGLLSDVFASSVTEPGDGRIRYIHLERNAGIAENTNQALPYATGDYVGLLDHDDILAESALYEMAEAIEAGKQQGTRPQMLYSDEDKCNGDRTEYYEPNFKEDFNLDLLLSNNYICHFLVMDRKLIQKLKFRQEYDGAQDYDLVLRAAAELGAGSRAVEELKVKKGIRAEKAPKAEKDLKAEKNLRAEKERGEAGGFSTAEDQEEKGKADPVPIWTKKEGTIVHVPKVLYHWRCHTGSTAENPQSKFYAYEAGRRAIQDFADRAGWRAKAVDTAHVGFYRLEYEGSLFDSRPDIGAVGGRVVSKGRIVGGRMTEAGNLLYENLPIHYSGYLHRAILSQDAYAVDLRNIRVRPECRNLFRKIIGASYQTLSGTDILDASVLPGDCDIYRASLAFCKALRDAGYGILYMPETEARVKHSRTI